MEIKKKQLKTLTELNVFKTDEDMELIIGNNINNYIGLRGKDFSVKIATSNINNTQADISLGINKKDYTNLLKLLKARQDITIIVNNDHTITFEQTQQNFKHILPTHISPNFSSHIYPTTMTEIKPIPTKYKELEAFPEYGGNVVYINEGKITFYNIYKNKITYYTTTVKNAEKNKTGRYLINDKVLNDLFKIIELVENKGEKPVDMYITQDEIGIKLGEIEVKMRVKAYYKEKTQIEEWLDLPVGNHNILKVEDNDGVRTIVVS